MGPTRARAGLSTGLFLLSLAGCGGAGQALAPSPAGPPKPAETQPFACVKRTGDATSDTFLFDRDGNLLRSERGLAGGRMEVTTFHRAPTGELTAYEVTGGFQPVTGYFTYGPHRELTSVHIAAANTAYLDLVATLSWRGKFTKVAGVNKPFAPYGGAGGATLSDVQVLSSNLNVRHASNPMPPVRFTGTVTMTHLGHGDRKELYTYRDGRLESWTGDGGARSTHAWDEADNLVEESWCEGKDILTGEPGTCHHATTTIEDGVPRSTRVDGDRSPLLELSYDAKGRVVFGRSTLSGAARADGVVWSECPVQPSPPGAP